MSHTKVTYRDGDEKADGMYFLREELDAENLGFTVVEADSDWTGMEHDHADEGEEEVYYLVEGAVTLHVDGESVELEPGDAVRVSPDATRQLETGSEESRLVVAGAP